MSVGVVLKSVTPGEVNAAVAGLDYLADVQRRKIFPEPLNLAIEIVCARGHDRNVVTSIEKRFNNVPSNVAAGAGDKDAPFHARACFLPRSARFTSLPIRDIILASRTGGLRITPCKA